MQDERLRIVLVLRTASTETNEPNTLQEVAQELVTTREYHACRLQRKAHELLRRDSGHLACLLEDAS